VTTRHANRAAVALDEHHRVLRLVERYHRRHERGCLSEEPTPGRAPTAEEVRDARIVYLPVGLASRLIGIFDRGEAINQPSVLRCRLPLDRLVMVVLDDLELSLWTSGELETARFGSLCVIPEVIRDDEIRGALIELGMTGAELIAQALMPLTDPCGVAPNPLIGLTLLNTTIPATFQDDDAHRLVNAIIVGLAAGELVIDALEDPTGAEQGRMHKARRQVEELRPKRFGDRLAGLAPAIDRRCMRADGAPKRRYTEIEARWAAGNIQAGGGQVRAYACTGRCGPNVWHVGHHRMPTVGK
jgi:hypothetical protein